MKTHILDLRKEKGITQSELADALERGAQVLLLGGELCRA